MPHCCFPVEPLLYLHTLIFPLGLGQLSTLFLSAICLFSPFSLLFLISYTVSQELRSVLQDLIPDRTLSQKCYINMGPIHNSSGVISFLKHSK